MDYADGLRGRVIFSFWNDFQLTEVLKDGIVEQLWDSTFNPVL